MAARKQRESRSPPDGAPECVRFETTLVTSIGKPVYHYLLVEKPWVAPLGLSGNLRRVVCKMNGRETIQCSLLGNGKGSYFISLNKTIRDKLGLAVGDRVAVELSKDDSKYGMPMPEEFEEVLKQDPEGDKLFHALTPGKQKNALYYAAKPKDMDRRIEAALTIVEHLKNNDGKLDHAKVYDELKRRAF